MTIQGPSPNFPVGQLLLDGQWRVVSRISGSAYRGRFQCESTSRPGARAVAAIALESKVDRARMIEMIGYDLLGVGAFLGMDRLEDAGRVFDAMLEALPLRTADFTAPVPLGMLTSVAVGLFEICAAAAAQQRCLLGIRPETVYVETAGQGYDVTVLPRCATFFKHAAAPHFNVTPVFEVPFDSPERLTGLPCSPASDVFSATATIAFLATGVHPYLGIDWQDTAESIRDGTRRRIELPGAVETLVAAGLAAQPSGRHMARDAARAWSLVRDHH